MSALNTRTKLSTLLSAWDAYCAEPHFDHFVEFALGVNTLAEILRVGPSVGLARISQDLEQEALALFGAPESHPISPEAREQLATHIRGLSQLLTGEQPAALPDRRQHSAESAASVALQPPALYLISDNDVRWQELQAQLGYFGLAVQRIGWSEAPRQVQSFFLLDLTGVDWPQLAELRRNNPASQLIALGLDSEFALMHQALKHGCDHCFPRDMSRPAMVAHILELQDQHDDDGYRVLIVDDSVTAHALIRRALAEQGIETRALADPRQVLDTLREFQPDLLLLDMYMPGCTGVEVARIIRQHPEYLSMPIVYLSGETDLALQVEALRLGGDHFLTKPFNPVFLNAIVKSKIERYRALRRSMEHDSLTGLLNHTSSKTQLDIALDQCRQQQKPLCVAMLDIDHFKQVNDRYGHPVGDQIIRSLAWLLKKRVRHSDILGRYGGEEFLLALPGASLSQGFAVLELLRQDFAAIHHPYADGYFQLSFSCGMAAYPAIESREALIQAADDALYRAKRGGRNRVECA
ncbi:GGDEF domain-containing response regulator [Chitinilyticum litopenaei]|uniref:GGDEF domain-containing response regulator n=1 Tax=Chitinilyticum litopenaei TaxID=1121276 RepID=UPI00041B5A85|nr:diguanylate cyclase [Chitinilyticum litopenaei]